MFLPVPFSVACGFFCQKRFVESKSSLWGEFWSVSLDVYLKRRRMQTVDVSTITVSEEKSVAIFEQFVLVRYNVTKCMSE